jgi:membrane protein
MAKPRFVRFFRNLNGGTFKKTFANTIKRRLLGLASEIAFNAMLSLFPAILAALTAIGLFEESLQQTFKQLAINLVKLHQKKRCFLFVILLAKKLPTQKTAVCFLSASRSAIWIASGAVSTAMTALDQIHQIPSDKIRPFWKAKLISLGLTIGTIMLFVMASFLVFISDFVLLLLWRENDFFGLLLHFWLLLRWALALGIVATAFAFIYRYGPSLWNSGTPIMPGAIIAAISWAIVSSLFRTYVANFGNYNIAYGAVGAVIVLMLWLWMSAAVLLIGDQLNVIVGEDMRSRQRSDGDKDNGW